MSTTPIQSEFFVCRCVLDKSWTVYERLAVCAELELSTQSEVG